MIIGIGIDMVELERVQRILDGTAGERFLQRVLTVKERKLAAQRKGKIVEFTAGRFAAKEAVSKALGCGIGGKVGLQDMEIVPDDSGKPVCVISEAAMNRLEFSEVRATLRIHVSITHTERTAAAYAVAERLS